ncbi:MAG: GlxA family transcriptional regulator [Paracoccaceae bacterium]
MTNDTDPAPLVPSGASYFSVASTGTAQAWAFILVPGFTLLAFSSAVEPLRIANQLSQQPLYRWETYSVSGGLVNSSSGVAIQTSALPDGFDRRTSVMVCGGNRLASVALPPVVAAVARHSRFGGKTGGICTGAIALASAGLLEGRRFTLHWENQPGFIETFPDLSPSTNRFEFDGSVLTCGGGAAATDMMLAIIAADHGQDFATMVAEMCLRTVLAGENAAQRSSFSALMTARNPVVSGVVRLMMQNLDDPLSMEQIVERTEYSRRQLERLFLQTLGETPRRFYLHLRLDHARMLLSTTDMTLIEVATATGFSSVAHFSRRFKERFGTAPTRLKTARQAVRFTE